MSVVDTFANSGARAFVLEIAGLPIRYWSGATPPTTSLPGVAGAFYNDVEAIIGVSDYEASIDLIGGIADISTVIVRLASNQFDADSSTDPGTVMGRLGLRSSNAIGTLLSTIDQDDALAGGIDMVEGSGSLFTAPGIAYIEQEAFWFTGITDDTLTGITRAIIGTRQQEHLVDPVTTSAPSVTDTLVNWRGRRATLKMAPIHNGVVGDYIEVAKGFIETTPSFDNGGSEVEIAIAPLTATMDNRIAPKSQAAAVGLVSGWHYFEEGVGDTIEIIMEMPEGRAVSTTLTGAGEAIGSGNMTTGVSQSAHIAIFDPVVLATPGHPRNGAMRPVLHDQTPSDVTGYNTVVNPNDEFTLAAGEPLVTIPGGAWIFNGRALEAKRAYISSGLQEWPEAARDAFNTYFQPGSASGPGGMWFDMQLATRVNGGPAIKLRPQEFCQEAKLLLGSNLPTWFSDLAYHWDGFLPPYEPSRLLEPEQTCWYGLDMAPINNDAYPRRDPKAREADRTKEWLHNIGPVGRDALNVAIRGVADAYYQTGEKYLIVDNPVPILDGGAETHLEIEYFDRGTNARETTSCRVDAISVAYHPTSGKEIGYLLEIKEEDRFKMPCFGVWPEVGSNGRVVIKPAIVFEEDTATDVILQLLLSGGGEHVNDAGKPAGYPFYDVQTEGANLNYDDVDVDSFRAITAPPRLNTWTMRVTEETTIGEVIEPILQITQSAMTMRINENGELKLARVRIGPENGIESVGTITDDDWNADNLPRFYTDDNIANVYKFLVNWNEDDGESKRTITVNDDQSIRSYNEANEIEIEVRGLELPSEDPGTAMQVLRGAYSLLRATSAHPRREWSGGIASGDALLAQLGTVYAFSSRFLRGYGDTVGITGEYARIRAIRVSLWTAEAELSAVHYGTRYTGWNAALKVTAEAAGVCTVDQTAYGNTGDDLDYWQVGDEVRSVALGDEDGATTHTITNINTGAGTITLNPAPANQVAPYYGDLVPVTRSDVPLAQYTLGFMAEASTGLFGNGDEGQQYA